MKAVEAVREGTNPLCHATVCREGSCSLSLSRAPSPSVLVDLEHEASPVVVDEAHCDYLFVGWDSVSQESWVSPIELTASAARVSKFLPQLRGGAGLAEKLLPADLRIKFRPVAAYGGELRRVERDRFLKPANQVVFRGKLAPVKLVRCGSRLTKALYG